ncbi:MAG TPA: hypothetical protein VKB56_13675 [Terriglobales bacterium]|nr:hypothetical protein [Terriglobales bacterium]
MRSVEKDWKILSAKTGDLKRRESSITPIAGPFEGLTNAVF